MREYRVIWEIDIDGDSAHDAAQQAQRLQRDLTARVGTFEVLDEDGASTTINLDA